MKRIQTRVVEVEVAGQKIPVLEARIPLVDVEGIEEIEVTQTKAKKSIAIYGEAGDYQRGEPVPGLEGFFFKASVYQHLNEPPKAEPKPNVVDLFSAQGGAKPQPKSQDDVLQGKGK